MDYAQGRLDGTICSDEEGGGNNPEGDEDETDEGNSYSLPLVFVSPHESYRLINEEILGVVTGSTSTTDYDEALNADEFGDKSEQRNSATGARTYGSTPDGNFLPKGVGGIIDDKFERMRQMLTPQIISRLELLDFSTNIYKEINTIFGELCRIGENYVNGSSAPQSNFLNPLNSKSL